MDDSTTAAVLAAVAEDVARLWAEVSSMAGVGLEATESAVRDGVLAIGARVLAAAVAAHGSGKAGPRHACACGDPARFEGYRTKQVQTVVGWIGVRRAYYTCAACGHGHCPRDAELGLARDSLSPGVRRLSCRLGALLPFAEAAATLAATARVQLSASTVRGVTEAVGERREMALATEICAAWDAGLPAVSGPPPERLYVAMDGVCILGADGVGHEVKVGVIRPERRTADAGRPAPASTGQLRCGPGARGPLRPAPGPGGASARGRDGGGGGRPRRWGGLDLESGRRALPDGGPDRRLVPRQ